LPAGAELEDTTVAVTKRTRASQTVLATAPGREAKLPKGRCTLSQIADLRVSRRFESSETNAFFDATSVYLHAVLANNVEDNPRELAEYYVCERLSSYSEANRSAILDRMPDDVKAFDQAGAGGRRLGYIELDLIDFVLHYPSNRLLSVVGSVGVGKTSFIRYVLQTVRSECPRLQAFAPIIVNCLAIGTRSPQPQDLLYELLRAIKSWTAEEAQRGQVRPELSKLYDDALQAYRAQPSAEETSAGFIDLVSRLKDSLGDKNQLLLVFDNLDQMFPQSVTEICSLARAVHVALRVGVVVTMRPTTYRTQAESAPERGAISHFSIEVRPPDLRSVIRIRMTKILRSHATPVVKTLVGVPIEILDVEKSVASISDKILNPKTQSVLIRDLCGDSVRKALAAVEYFLRYRDLKYHLLFATKTDAIPVETLHGNWFDHLLDGLMIGSRRYYADGNGPISNVMTFDCSGKDDFFILHWCLAALSWTGRFTTRRTIIDWLLRVGFREDHCVAALDHLISRRLLFCPTSESAARVDAEIKLSRIGTYYLGTLLKHPQYIYNAIFDVPITHARWQEGGDDTFPVRIHSICDFLSKLSELECDHLDLICNSSETNLDILSIANHSLTLTRKLLTAAETLIMRSRYARFSGAREAAEHVEGPFAKMDIRVASTERRIREALKQHRWLPSTEQTTKRLERSLGHSSDLTVEIPVQVGPALRNEIKLLLTLPEEAGSDRLTLFWQGETADHSYQELAELKRSSADGQYRCDFVVSGVKDIAEFLRSRVTVFSATKPLFVAALGV
jgi:hypothetical protein